MPNADQPTTRQSGAGSAQPPKLILVGERIGPPTLGLTGAQATSQGLIRPAARERVRGGLMGAAAVVVTIAVAALVLSAFQGQSGSVRQTTISAVDLQILRRVSLSPTSADALARGRAAVARRGRRLLLLLEGGGLPANRADVYAVWLEGPVDAARLLGLISPPVTSTGTFATGAELPTDASSFTTVLITRETTSTPSQPGTVVLTGHLPGGLSR